MNIASFKYDDADKGISFVKNCTFLNGKYYYIDISQVDWDKINKYIPIYVDSDINSVENGIYIWIITETNTHNGPHLYFSKVYSVNELGTKHANLALRIGATNMYLAGEMLIYNSNVLYNYLSGTYMADKYQLDKIDENLINEFRQFVSNFADLTIKYTTKNFINPNNMLLTYNDLNFMVKLGAIIEEYSNNDLCQQRQNYPSIKRQNKQDIESYERLLTKVPNTTKPRPREISPPERGTQYNQIRRSERLDSKYKDRKYSTLLFGRKRKSKKRKSKKRRSRASRR